MIHSGPIQNRFHRPPTYFLAISAGDGQTATVATALDGTIGTTKPKVRVTNIAGAGVSGLNVVFQSSGDGIVNGVGYGDVVVTDVNGYADCSWEIPTQAGQESLTATLLVTGASTTFTATGTPDVAVQIQALTSVNQAGSTSTPVSVVPSLIAFDTYFNPVPGVSINWAVASGGGSINSTGGITTNAAGIATITSWTLGPSVGANSITASSAGLIGSPITFSASAVSAGPTQISVFSGGAQTNIVAGQPASPTVYLVQDNSNNPVQNVTVRFSTDSTGSLSVVSAVTDASGHASVTLTTGDLIETATVYGTFADVSGVDITASTTIASTYGAAAKLAIRTQPSNTGQSGSALIQQPVIEVQDIKGNLVANSSLLITATVGSGNAVITGGSTKSAVNGVAAFSGFTVTDVDGGSNVFHFAASGVTGCDSSGTVLTPPIPTQIIITVQPSNTNVGVNGLSVTAIIADASGVRVPGSGNAVTAQLTTPGTAVLSSTQAGGLTQSAVDGTVSLTSMAVDTSGTYSLTLTAAGLTSAVSVSFGILTPGTVYANLPAGFNTLHEFFHDKTTGELGPLPAHAVAGVTGWIGASGNFSNLERNAGVSDNTAPFGSAQVSRTRGAQGNVFNGIGFCTVPHWSGSLLTNPQSELYICRVFKVIGTPGFEQNAGGMKQTIFHSGHASQDTINMMWLHNPTGIQQVMTAWPWQMRQQGGSNPNVMGQINWSQNNGFSGVNTTQVNVWQRMEIYAKISTLGAEVLQANGTYRADGILKVWLTDWNGSSWGTPKLIMTYSNVCYRRNATGADKLFMASKWYSCYGGGSTIALSQNDDFYDARWMVAGKP